MKTLLTLLLFTSIIQANDLFSYSLNYNLLFLFNEERQDYKPGIGLDAVFMIKPVRNFGFGISPEYSFWSLKFEDESVSYRLHSIRTIFFVRPFIPLKDDKNIYFQFGSGFNNLFSVYDRDGPATIIHEYTNFILTSRLGIKVKRFDCAIRFGTFNENNLDVFVYTGISIGYSW